MRDQVFVSYSHKDVQWLDRLKINLKPSVRAGRLTVWDDQLIAPSAKWRDEIETALTSAKVALLLVSPDFLASDFIADHELPVLLESAKKDGVKILWVAVRYSNYKDTEIEQYQAINDPQTPLDSLSSAEVDKEFVKICEVIRAACPPVPIEESTRSAGEGMQVLARLMGDPAVQRSVAAFAADFETSSTQIDVLGRYKHLHDSLHNLQFECYNYIQETVRSAKKDSSNWDNLAQYDTTIRRIIDGLNRSTQDEQFDSFKPSIATLIQNLKVLLTAVRNPEASQIEAALQPISRVLNTLPWRVNERLAEAARHARLPQLVAALTSVRHNLDKFGIDAARRDKFENGLKALIDLNANLVSQIESHSKWQDIDVDLRLIEAGIERDFTELDSNWPDLKRKVSELSIDKCDPWAEDLADVSQRLEEAMNSNDPVRIRRSFYSYRSTMGYRFYQVDDALKELCGKLNRVGDPLKTIWEMTW
jgi:hypothetical protein